MKRSYFYLAIAILTFAVGTFFAFYFYSQKIEPQFVLQNETVNTPSKQILQTETQGEKTLNLINFDDLKINGIGLSSFEKDLVKKFGKPKKLRNNGNFYNCSDEYSRTLFYEGLEIDVTHNSESKKYEINEIDISSSKFQLVSGIKIGDDIKHVLSKFGDPYNQNIGYADIDQYHFMVTNKNDVSNDGGVATFSFRNNKLVKIHWHYNFC
ncbi:MAG: hypothetical protein AAB336_08040 [Acidobacteriota bacterium]